MLQNHEIYAQIVKICEGGMKGTHIFSIVGVSMKTMQTIIKQFKKVELTKEILALKGP